MISSTGNNSNFRLIKILNQRQGISFIEIMVAFAILASAMVIITQSLVISLDRMSYLTNRLYAFVMADNRLKNSQRILRFYNALPFELEKVESLKTGSKIIDFKQRFDIRPVEDLPSIFHISLNLSWLEGKNLKTISRQTYISQSLASEE